MKNLLLFTLFLLTTNTTFGNCKTIADGYDFLIENANEIENIIQVVDQNYQDDLEQKRRVELEMSERNKRWYSTLKDKKINEMVRYSGIGSERIGPFPGEKVFYRYEFIEFDVTENAYLVVGKRNRTIPIIGSRYELQMRYDYDSSMMGELCPHASAKILHIKNYKYDDDGNKIQVEMKMGKKYELIGILSYLSSDTVNGIPQKKHKLITNLKVNGKTIETRKIKNDLRFITFKNYSKSMNMGMNTVELEIVSEGKSPVTFMVRKRIRKSECYENNKTVECFDLL